VFPYNNRAENQCTLFLIFYKSRAKINKSNEAKKIISKNLHLLGENDSIPDSPESFRDRGQCVNTGFPMRFALFQKLPLNL
jgi:hypothetical protein